MSDKKTSGFDTLMWIDDQVIGVYNWIQRSRFSFYRHRQKYNLKRNIELKDKHKGQRCFIVGNGPSIKGQDLTLLKDEYTFFVNYFYRHDQISEINPKYYAIVDPKLVTGEWPLSMLDEIIDKCPQANLLMAAQYQDTPEIAAYGEKVPIYWLYANQFLHEGFSCSTDLTRSLGGANVITICLFSAIYMGFNEIYLLGVDCDGLFRDLVDTSSHFYEAKKENIGDNDPVLVVRNLRSSIQGIRGWSVIAKKFENSSHKIVNLTQGGLLNAFIRDDFEKVF
ncbi:MAG: DUF115 domain-containing protein [Moorea sp. SIO3C2]|nr:DUF115 domain-containing protein [Moorena sp. SIO3C2]